MRANIPLEKADHPAVQQFLSIHVKGGGAIPKSDSLRTVHLPLLIEEHEAKLHLLVNQTSYISIIVDETTDAQNRPVLNILFQLLQPIHQLKGDVEELSAPLLMKTVFWRK